MSIFHCCNNLQGQNSFGLTDDLFASVRVGSSPTILLNQDKKRGLIKLYVTNLEADALWIKYGANITLESASHILLLRHLLIVEPSQAANSISAICLNGFADVRVSWALKV